MPTGRHTHQIGRSGEYYVVAELSRRGFDATTFTGNLPHVDILAIAPDWSALYFQVKTQTGKGWQLDARERLRAPIPRLYWVLALLRNDEEPRYWVIPDAEMQTIIQAEYDSRPHQFDPNKPKVYHMRLPEKSIAGREGGWERLGRDGISSA